MERHTAMDEDGLWVQIETTKGVDKVSSFRGYISATDFKLILQGAPENAWISIKHTHWMPDTNFEYEAKRTQSRVIRYGLGDKYRNFEGTLYLLAKHIVTMALLTGNTTLPSPEDIQVVEES